MTLNVGLPGGAMGRNTAIAQGKITISIDNSRQTVIAASQQMGNSIRQNLGGATRDATRDADRQLQGLNRTLASTARAFAAAFSIRQAVSAGQQVQRLNALFIALTGSEEKATQELARLRQLADDTKQPFLDMAEGATALLPVIGRTNADLAQAVSIAQRLALLDPVQGIEGASIAIRELLSGEVRSLSARFELSRADLRELLDRAGGDPQAIIDGLGAMVDQMGLTEEAYAQMGQEGINAFGVLRSEMQETIALGITPLLTNAIIPMVQGFSEAFRAARELNPELVELTTTILGLAAAGQALQFAGVPGAGRAGLLAGAAFAGVELGTAAARFGADQGIIDNPALENASQSEARQTLLDTFKMAVVAAADTLVSLIGVLAIGAQTFENAFNRAKLVIDSGAQAVNVGLLVARDAAFDLRDGFIQVTRDMRTGLSQFLVSLGASIPGGAGGALTEAGLGLLPRLDPEAEFARAEQSRERDQAIADAAQEWAQIVAQLQNAPLLPTADQAGQIAGNTDRLRQSLVGGLFETLFPEQAAPEQQRRQFSRNARGSDFSEEQLEAWSEFQDDLTDIQTEANERRLEAEASHQDALDDLHDNRNRQRRREEEDELRRRRKAEQDLATSIAETQADGAEKIASLVQKQRDDDLKAETQYQRKRTDRLRDLGRSLRDAASKLDAAAVFNLLQRNREQAQDEKTAQDREREDRQREREGQLDEIRQQTQERIAALRQQFDETEAERAEQRAIQRQREDEDFQLQLEKLNEQQVERLAQIDRQESEQAQARQEAFIEQHNQMIAEQGDHNERMINVQRRGTDVLEREYAAFLARMQSQHPAASAPARPRRGGGGRYYQFAAGGRVPATGPIFAHEGEEVLRARTASMLRRQMGGRINQDALAQMASMFAGDNSHRSVGTVNQTINGTNLTPSQLERVVENAMVNLLERM